MGSTSTIPVGNATGRWKREKRRGASGRRRHRRDASVSSRSRTSATRRRSVSKLCSSWSPMPTSSISAPIQSAGPTKSCSRSSCRSTSPSRSKRWPTCSTRSWATMSHWKHSSTASATRICRPAWPGSMRCNSSGRRMCPTSRSSNCSLDLDILRRICRSFNFRRRIRAVSCFSEFLAEFLVLGHETSSIAEAISAARSMPVANGTMRSLTCQMVVDLAACDGMIGGCWLFWWSGKASKVNSKGGRWEKSEIRFEIWIEGNSNVNGKFCKQKSPRENLAWK